MSHSITPDEWGPRSLDRKRESVEAHKEAELVEALKLARETLGEDHPLVKKALRQLRSNERRCAERRRDDLSVQLYGETHGTPEAERRRVFYLRRRDRQRANGGSHTEADIQAQYERQHGRCFYCKAKLTDYHVDHVIPLALGGSSNPENLVVACPECNKSKCAKHPMDFAGMLF